MKIAVLGTGMVGETLASKLVALGHEVKMGSRTANNEKAVAWAKKAGAKASQGTFADAAAFGEFLFNCTLGSGSLDALSAAGAQNLQGKILLDTSNPLDFSKGMPPSLFVPSNDSLGERIQRAFPDLKVVKTLNTINANVMVEPSRIPGEHAVFVSGNDAEAKRQVKELLTGGFGWKQVIDLGDITTSRGTEAYLMLWIRLWGALGTPDFNISIAKKG
ncbi:NADPH-dependent F420 reductase [Archangium sp.]|uniref:NADPH-dependent F420 reductase n=1 Tax=Archangium sp. TaxID=1872627 RepID=UPI002D6ADA32|nr:NAD(P)-binding domain-containing protein [Archangium sp.]HYO52284.1 NAD(P)-binding domain-containing protein [Archangium sp.]